MWNYNNQIKIRWTAFILAALAAGAVIFVVSGNNPEILTQAGLKTFLTSLSVSFELMPAWGWAAIFFSMVILQLVGIPSAILFAMLYPVAGFFAAFFSILFCQIFTSFIAIRRSWQKFDQNRLPIKLTPTMKNLLVQLKESEISFVFWSRIYFAFPLRTIDMYSPLTESDEKNITSDFFPLVSAIGLRMLIPALWIESFVDLTKNFSPNPGADSSMFLMWSSALVAYTLIPRIPELFICPDSVKKVLVEIEKSVSPKDNKQLDSELILTPAEKKAIRKNTSPQKQEDTPISNMQTRTV